MSKWEIFITWLVFCPVLLYFLISELYSHEYSSIPMTVIALVLVIFSPILYNIGYDSNAKKPVKCVKAKLIKKPFPGRNHTFTGVFLLSDGNKLKLTMTENQYCYLNKNDDVTLMYQGVWTHSVKKDTDKIPFFNGEYDSGKKFAKYAFKYPIQSAKAKVVSKAYGNSVIFLLSDKSKIEMTVSKKQYKELKKRDTLDIIYQGWILYYIKKEDEKPIYNEDFSSKKILMEYMSKK